ncbi:hypothetical protein F4777DRAFT_582238 [Nemania sp. FL0916]|nr:hypothetical protein F4777DRAFT_582238 [Nemania sp. FL0916]
MRFARRYTLPTTYNARTLLASIWILLHFIIQHVSTESLCGMLHQRNAIVGDRLFFSTGGYTYENDSFSFTPTLYWIHLNDTIDFSGCINVDLLGSIALPSEGLKTSLEGVFFYDRTTLYLYAGLIQGEANKTDNSLWAFNSTSDSWSSVSVKGERFLIEGGRGGVHASDPRTGTSFYTGGYEIAYNGTNNGTVKFQSFNSDAPTWTFETAITGIQGPSILYGAMVYVRQGQAGVLIALGGYDTTDGFVNLESELRSLSDIFIYDISSNIWYLQTASGDVPTPRYDISACVSSAPDNSSFQITIYGGMPDPSSKPDNALNEIYVLSIPSFRWIRVNGSGNPDFLGSDKPGLALHQCDVWNNGQLIISGGVTKSSSNITYPPFRILDSSSYSWRSQLSSTLEYSVPEVVTAVIGGNSSGGATLIAPSGGWNSSELASIFNQTVSRDEDPVPVPPDEPKFDGDPESSGKPKSNGGLSSGIIAGIVVGSVTIVAAISATSFFCWRRKNSVKAHIEKPQIRVGTETKPGANSWHKPELDAEATRYELSAEAPTHELHGDDHIAHEMLAHGAPPHELCGNDHIAHGMLAQDASPHKLHDNSNMIHDMLANEGHVGGIDSSNTRESVGQEHSQFFLNEIHSGWI